jgi:hypothetical protein
VPLEAVKTSASVKVQRFREQLQDKLHFTHASGQGVRVNSTYWEASQVEDIGQGKEGQQETGSKGELANQAN